MKIFLVFKTHFDIGFTGYARDVIRQYQEKMLPEVIDTCQQTAGMGKLKYVWTMPAWPLLAMRDNPERRQELDQLIQNGQVVWHALPYTSHFDFCGLADYIHGFHYAAELSAAYHRPLPISAKMTDVPGHGQALPTLLSAAGIRFLHLGCNAFSSPPDVPPLFFWEGPDGSRVLTMYSAGGYGSQLLPPEDWPFPVWMALMHTHDNCGPQSADMIRALEAEARQACPDAEILCGSMDDFYHALETCSLSSLPVVRQDLADTWIHGVGTYPAEVRMVRQTRRDLLAAHTAAFLSEAGGRPLWEASRRAYDALALFGEHTWGMDVKTFMAPTRVYRKDLFQKALSTEEYRRMEASWDEQRQRASSAGEYAQQALELLAAPGQRAVLNPNGSAFTGWADADAGTPSAVAFPDGHKVYVENVPPVSVRPLSEVTPKSCLSAPPGGLENHRYRLSIDQRRGVITELYDKKFARPLLKERDGVGVFSYRYDIYGIEEGTEYLRSYAYRFFDWGIRDNMKDQYPEISHTTCQPEFLGLEQQGCSVTLRYRGTGCDRYGDSEEIRIEISLPPLGDELFLHVALEGKQKTPYTESGCVAFPLADGAPAYRINKNGNLLDPSADIAPQANHALYCIEDFLCAQSQDYGVCLISKDAPLFSIGETGIYTYRKDFAPRAPILYCGLFNNMWGTNFPQWTGGDFRFRFTLFGYSGTADGDLYGRALALAQGARVLPAAPAISGLRLPEGVQVIHLLPEPSGWTLYLRDTALTTRPITLRFPGRQITPVDLRGVPIEPGRPDSIETVMRAFGILAFRIEQTDSRARNQ